MKDCSTCNGSGAVYVPPTPLGAGEDRSCPECCFDWKAQWRPAPTRDDPRASVTRHDQGGYSVSIESKPRGFRKSYVCAEYAAVETILEQWLVHGKAIKLDKV